MECLECHRVIPWDVEKICPCGGKVVPSDNEASLGKSGNRFYD